LLYLLKANSMPGYIVRFDNSKSFKENLVENVLQRGGYLYEEAEILFKTGN